MRFADALTPEAKGRYGGGKRERGRRSKAEHREFMRAMQREADKGAPGGLVGADLAREHTNRIIGGKLRRSGSYSRRRPDSQAWRNM